MPIWQRNLPNEILSEIAAHPGEPLRVEAPNGGTAFYLVNEKRLTHLEAAAHEKSEATTQKLREWIKKADASPDVDTSIVHDELMERVRAHDHISMHIATC